MTLLALFTLICWLSWFAAIFTGFTFADPEDFGPLLSLIVGLSCAFSIHVGTRRPASSVLVATMILLSLWPLLPHVGLFFLAQEFQAANGTWPQVMVDDPKNQLGGISLRYDNLFSVVNYLHAFAGAWMVSFWSLLLVLRTRFSLFQRRLFTGVCLFAMGMFVLDPGGLYAWWLD